MSHAASALAERIYTAITMACEKLVQSHANTQQFNVSAKALLFNSDVARVIPSIFYKNCQSLSFPLTGVLPVSPYQGKSIQGDGHVGDSSVQPCLHIREDAALSVFPLMPGQCY